MKCALLVTCLVDLWRPEVGFATVSLLESVGCQVEVPSQTCCGQPAYNSGDRVTAQDAARQMIDAMEFYEAVVVPSGSCAAMVIVHYPDLLADDHIYAAKAVDLAGRTFELTKFLTLRGMTTPPGAFAGRVVHHHPCSCLRELGLKHEPEALLSAMPGTELMHAGQEEVCCGFGGTFAVKYADISAAIAKRKADDLVATGADMIVSSDLGCLLNIAGTLSRAGATIPVRHIAEVLAGALDAPAIGQKRQPGQAPR
jgi:L-lactate dehydrogenase complex protein LldE